MPAIRDTSFAYETVITDGGLTIPMCAYEAGDLLFAFCVGDTGAPTWGCSNGVGTWNQLIAQNNSASFVVYWKYAAASGEGDVVFTSTVNETYSGALVAVRDAYQGYTSGSPPLKSNTTSTGTKIALPTITTTADNSLILAAIGNTAAAGSIAFIDSALQDLVKVDGSAESLGVGWFFKQSAGLTTAYNASSLASGSGVKCVIECRAPAGGANVIPAYPVSDASILLSPGPSAAWDSNTALAATADTNFGTSIAGKTCNDGTVAAAVDIGIDKGAFMSFAGLTNAVTANQISGAEAVMAAARYNVGNRNILGHFRHPTPAHNQRLSPLSSGRGIWFGMKSDATALANWKVWQVHGNDVAMPGGYVMPIVINAANTDTIATNGTLNNADVRRYGFWVGGIGALTNQACFGPMWAMDTTVIAGGNTAEPIDIPAIIQSAALNKVRFSSLLQGSNQMLCLQAIQFGDGGTNPTYLKVNGGAVEFPSQKNFAKKLVNYNGIDNAVGWTFYPGASDTVDLSGTAFASASKFHWRIHASASASASWNLAGVAINGAGDVQLRPVTTFEQMSFSNCLTIVQNGSAIQSSSFSNSTISTCDNPANISDCSFTSGGTGHALVITAAGTYSFSGNTFAGYGANDTTDAAIYNNSGGAVTLNISGGGSTPTVRNGAGASTNIVSGVTITIEASGVSLSGAEIRIYDFNNIPAGSLGTELAGTESNVGATFAYAGTPANTVWIQIMQAGYVEFNQQYILPSSNSTFTAILTPDTNA